MESLLTTEQVAEWLQVDVVTVRRLVDRGELAAYRVGGEYRFDRADVQQYLTRVRVENPRRAAAGQPSPGRLPGPLGALFGKPGHETHDRFAKFTERARKVLAFSQEEAQRLNHPYIGTEHMLLGLLREGEGVAAKLLVDMGVDLDRARAEVESIVGRGDRVVMGTMGMTPRAKKVLELAVDEARRLNHHYIGTEHLLLGLVREGEGIAAGVLGKLGVDLEAARKRLVQMLTEQREG